MGVWDYMKTIYAVIAIIPIIPFVTVLVCYSLFTGDRKKALRLAMDISTMFFIGTVAALFNNTFDSKFGLYAILLIMLIGGGLLGNAQYRKRGSVDIKRIFFMVWRLTFFLMCICYIILVPIELGKFLFNPT
ncbi:DUF3397 domain-containing protein [Paenibacillus yanchengensis]|uniref:DUF3397 domain-containing protein n=1 Tax=Paenibacillus yanchengensis TaxID=2035833 RepID=A0ABW4YL24_9BACL